MIILPERDFILLKFVKSYWHHPAAAHLAVVHKSLGITTILMVATNREPVEHQGLLVTVDGTGSVEEVSERLKRTRKLRR